MRATMAAAAALAGGLFLLTTAHGPASAMSAPINLKNIIGTIPGSVELAGHGGGGRRWRWRRGWRRWRQRWRRRWLQRWRRRWLQWWRGGGYSGG